MMKSPYTKNTHLQAASSQSTNQSLQESIFSLTQEKLKNKKSPPKMKNKTLPPNNPTDIETIIETVDKQKGMSLEKKEGQLVTGGIFYCRDSAGHSVSASDKLFPKQVRDILCNLAENRLEIPNGLNAEPLNSQTRFVG